nr:response regulator [Eubacterium sp.]
MKKVLLIGKIGTDLNELGKYLGEHFVVHMSADNVVMVKNMLKLIEPEMVLIYLSEFNPDSVDIFEILTSTYALTPVICLGTEVEERPFHMYLTKENVLGRLNAQEKEEILNVVCETLDVELSTKKRILLVDDNAMQLRVLNTMLKENFDVKMATSGAQALEMIEKQVPDIIFLDYEMPEQDGKETLRQIREMEQAKDVPVVFLTGVGDKPHIEAVLALKPAGYLLKPASKEMIFEMLEKHI